MEEPIGSILGKVGRNTSVNSSITVNWKKKGGYWEYSTGDWEYFRSNWEYSTVNWWNYAATASAGLAPSMLPSKKAAPITGTAFSVLLSLLGKLDFFLFLVIQAEIGMKSFGSTDHVLFRNNRRNGNFGSADHLDCYFFL